jgi:hypothetical protein
LLVCASQISTSSEIITNDVLPAPSKQEVVRAFTGKLKRWDAGDIVVVFVLPRTHAATRQFVYETLGITPSAFEDVVKEAQANQQRVQMRMLETENQMLRNVAFTIGSIGYVNNTLLVNQGSGYVKIINMR